MTPNRHVAELLARWRQMRDAGKILTAEELCRDRPDLLPIVRQLLNGAGAAETATLARAGPATAPPTPPSDSKTQTDACNTVAAGFNAQTAQRQRSRNDSISDQARAIPGYEVLGELGRGGMGVVYQARHLKLNRTVALKMILAGPHASANDLVRFLGEAEAVAQIQHPNIVQIFETGTHDGLPWFSLEYVEAGSLADKVRESPLSPREAAALVEQIARGVQAAHDRGIIHRDLKPENVLLTVAGVPKVTDFGLAKRIEGGSGLTHTGALMGTPSYMAPEQVEGKKTVGLAADVWGLGAVLYRVLTGRPPFQAATTLDTVVQVMCEEPVPPSKLLAKLPRDLETICLKCLQKEPNKRYANAAALADDLQRFLKGEAIVARPVGRLERGIKWVRRNPVAAGATAAVLATLLLGTTVSYLKYLDAETARKAEANRVRERDAALRNAEIATAAELMRVTERDEALVKRNEALAAADAHAKDLSYQLGISDFLLANSALDNRNSGVALEHLLRVPMEQRKFEWRYLANQIQGGIFTLRGHRTQVLSVAFSPDGTRIATGSLDATIKIWDARSGSVLLDLTKNSGQVRGLCFSPDGTRLLSGAGNTARIWDVRTGALSMQLVGHKEHIRAVSYSPDGTKIVTGGGDSTVRVWDARTGTQLLNIQAHSGSVFSLSFSPDGTRIITGGNDSTAKVWDAGSGALQLELRGNPQGVRGVSFSPDGSRIVTGGQDGIARVWDAHSGKLLVELKGHAQTVVSVSFSPDGKRIATGSWDNTAKLWDARDGALLLDLKSHASFVHCACFSPDGTRIVTGSEDHTAKVWDAHFGVPMLELNGSSMGLSCASFSADGKRIVTACWDNTATIWDARLGTPLLQLSGHKESIKCASFSKDGTRIITGSEDGTARVWDAANGTLLLELKGHKNEVRGALFSPDGKKIVTGSADHTAKVWDSSNGELLLDLKRHAEEVNGVAFSTDGSRIATAGEDATAKVWDAQTGDLLFDLTQFTHSVDCIGFSPDGTKVITGSADKTAKVWDLQTSRPIADLTGHTGIILSVGFSPDGTRIVTSSYDRTAKVWDARTGVPLLELKGNKGAVHHAAFSSDGTKIVTTDDNTARVWDGRPDLEFGSLEYRLFWTRPNVQRHRQEFTRAYNEKNTFAASYHLDRLLAYFPDERRPLLLARSRLQLDPTIKARAQFRTLALNGQPSWESVAMLAVSDDSLNRRLMAQWFLAAGKPEPALPLLYVSLLGRRSNQPPVEEFLIAQTLLDLKKPDEAKHYYETAIEWLNKAQRPLWACDLVAAGFASPWQALANLAGPAGDPRYNEFDWETWYECEVFRARIESKMRN